MYHFVTDLRFCFFIHVLIVFNLANFIVSQNIILDVRFSSGSLQVCFATFLRIRPSFGNPSWILLLFQLKVQCFLFDSNFDMDSYRNTNLQEYPVSLHFVKDIMKHNLTIPAKKL